MKYNYFRLSPRQEFNDIIADYSARNGYFDNFKPVITQADIIQKKTCSNNDCVSLQLVDLLKDFADN